MLDKQNVPSLVLKVPHKSKLIAARTVFVLARLAYFLAKFSQVM